MTDIMTDKSLQTSRFDDPSSTSDNGTVLHTESNEEHAPVVQLTVEEEDRFPMPTIEQVARSMARAMRFKDTCPHQEELARQILEGRKMMRSERDPQRHEREPQSTCAPHQPIRQNADCPPKKRRNRNRNRSGKPAHTATV